MVWDVRCHQILLISLGPKLGVHYDGRHERFLLLRIEANCPIFECFSIVCLFKSSFTLFVHKLST